MSRPPAPISPAQLPTGVPGLDEVLGGGIPERSLTLITGGAGTGKTTLAQQIAFSNASTEQPAVYISGLGEPPDRLRGHQQQLTFFDADRIDRDIHYIDLGSHFTERDAGRVLELLKLHTATQPQGVVVVDLPRALTPATVWTDIVVFLAQSETTAVIVVDSGNPEHDAPAALSVADVVVHLEQASPGRRWVHALKTRGQAPMAGRHTMQLTERGMRVFPRWPTPRPHVPHCVRTERLSVGVEGIDRLLGGGVAAGGSVLLEGASGSGKSILASQFIAESGHQGLRGLVVLCEERPDRLLARGDALDLQLDRLVQGGLVEVLSCRGRDITADELMHLIQRTALGMRAQSVLIDSTVGPGPGVRRRESRLAQLFVAADG